MIKCSLIIILPGLILEWQSIQKAKMSAQDQETESLAEKQVRPDLTWKWWLWESVCQFLWIGNLTEISPDFPNHSVFQPYRNTTMVLAEPKTIHELKEIENKFVTNSGEPIVSAYR